MTPNPPSSSDEPAFPRKSRSSLGDVVKDSTELDLWAFDDVDVTEDTAPQLQVPPVSPAIPMPRERRKKAAPDPAPDPDETPTAKAAVRVDIRQEPVKTPDASTITRAATPDDFDELDEQDRWVESEPPELSIHPSLLNSQGEAAKLEEPVPAKATTPSKVTALEEPDEFSPVVPENAKPISLVPHLQLSKVEWIGLGALCMMLLAGAVVVFFNSIHRLPAGAERLKPGDFPIEGRHLTILSADSFWRPPITEGENADTFRRGTQLLPVVELTSSGNPGAVRVIFRDQDGRGAGDVVTLSIKPGVPLRIAATAGFEDVGMHAAYRAGQSEPWTIEVFEAPSVSASNSEFKKLFEIDISTARR